MSVVLNDVGKSHLKNKGDTAMPTPFTITLNECNTTGVGDTKAKKVGVYFYSWENADKENNFTLKNKTTSNNDFATMVNIQLLEDNGTDEIKVVGKGTTDFTNKNTGTASNITNIFQVALNYKILAILTYNSLLNIMQQAQIQLRQAKYNPQLISKLLTNNS